MGAEPSTQLQVVAGLFVSPGLDRVLMALRHRDSARGDMWEFPGGKVEGNETHQEALVRELQEELGVTAQVGDLISSLYLSLELDFTVFLYHCTLMEGTPRALASVQVSWVDYQHAVTYMPLIASCYSFYRPVCQKIAAMQAQFSR